MDDLERGGDDHDSGAHTFDAFLMDLYRARKPPQTVADLYPQIIEWFEKNGAAALSQEVPRQ